MKYKIDIPPQLAWLIGIYEKKAEIRRKVGGSGTVEDEILIAMEQQAIQSIENRPGHCNCPICKNNRSLAKERQHSGE